MSATTRHHCTPAAATLPVLYETDLVSESDNLEAAPCRAALQAGLWMPRPGLVDPQRDSGPAISALCRGSFPCVDAPLRHPYSEDAAAGKPTENSTRRCAASSEAFTSFPWTGVASHRFGECGAVIPGRGQLNFEGTAHFGKPRP